MAQVAEYRIGNTTIRVFDDACKSQAEVEEILRRIGRLASRGRTQPDRPAQGEAAHRPTHRHSSTT